MTKEEQEIQVPEHTVDLDKFEPKEHKWVDRGLVMTCEDAGHPMHRHFKINRSLLDK